MHIINSDGTVKIISARAEHQQIKSHRNRAIVAMKDGNIEKGDYDRSNTFDGKFDTGVCTIPSRR